jgi:hypothetical protein
MRGGDVPISVTNIMPAGINTPFFSKARSKIGVKPRPPRPIYEPGVVAELILYAAEHPVAELFAGGAARALSIADALVPHATEFILSKVGFEVQKTNEQRVREDDNLFHPIDGHNRARGDFGNLARRRSLYNWIEMHPGSRIVATSILLGLAGVLLLRKSAKAG